MRYWQPTTTGPAFDIVDWGSWSDHLYCGSRNPPATASDIPRVVDADSSADYSPPIRLVAEVFLWPSRFDYRAGPPGWRVDIER